MSDLVTMGRLDTTEGFVPTSPEENGTLVLDGNQNARIHTLVENENVYSGLSMADPCIFSITITSPTILTLLEGEADFTIDGATTHMTPGDVAFFEPGAEVVWNVKTPVKDWFIMLGPFEE